MRDEFEEALEQVRRLYEEALEDLNDTRPRRVCLADEPAYVARLRAMSLSTLLAYAACALDNDDDGEVVSDPALVRELRERAATCELTETWQGEYK